MSNLPPEVQAIGFLVLALGALLGMAGAAVGLFVLRVEFVQLVRRVAAVEKHQAEGE